ncbi:MAG: hypothetical protein K0R24_1869 [Gammaproteobacteria bacterium]|jgi:hypothetical protein|nr:hypothetical protein [Gammaproteobacteria bacterium]
MLRKSDREAPRRLNAKTLLEKRSNSQAFFLAYESAPENERVELVCEAVDVFCRKGQTRELKRLAELDYPIYVERERIIDKIIKALITCNDIHSAIGIAVLEDKLSFICRELVTNKCDMTRYIDRLYDQINGIHQRRETADYFLKYYDPNENTEIWFKWYSRYLDEEGNHCLRMSTSQEHFDTYFDLGVRRYPRLLEFLRNPQHIKKIYHYCKMMPELRSSKLLPPEFFEGPSDYHQAAELACQIPTLQSESLVGHLYCYFILEEDTLSLKRLEGFLSEKNQWLSNVARLMHEDGDFSVFHSFYSHPFCPYRQEVDSLIKRAFTNLFMRHKEKSDNALIKIIKENCKNFESKMRLRHSPYYYVGSSLQDYSDLVESFIEYCKKESRFTLALLLNAHLLKKEEIFLDILKNPTIVLPEESYLVILDYELKQAICNIESKKFFLTPYEEKTHACSFYISYFSKLLPCIPKHIIDREAPYLRDRFIQRGSEFDEYKEMESNHPLYGRLTEFIKDLSDIHEHTHCLRYLSILIKSKFRTQLIYKPLYDLIHESNYKLALQFIDLYHDENDCVLFKEFIKNLSSNEYINALSLLVQLTSYPNREKESLVSLVWDRYIKTKTPEQYLEDIAQLSLIMHAMGIEKMHDQFITFFLSDMPRKIENLLYSTKDLKSLSDDEYGLLRETYQQQEEHYIARVIEKFIEFELSNDYSALCKKLLSRISNHSFSDSSNDRNERYCSFVIKIIKASIENNELFDEIDRYIELKEPPTKIKLQLIESIQNSCRRQLGFIKLYVSLLNNSYSNNYSLATSLGFKISPNENGFILSILPLCYQHYGKKHFEYILLNILVHFSELHTEPHFIHLKNYIIKSIENEYSSVARQVLSYIKECEKIGWNNVDKEKNNVEKTAASLIAATLDELYRDILAEKTFTATLSHAVLHSKASIILSLIPFFYEEHDRSFIINTLIHFKALHRAPCLAEMKNRLIGRLTYDLGVLWFDGEKSLLDHAHQLDEAAWQLLDQEEKSPESISPHSITEIATMLYRQWLPMINTDAFAQDAFEKQRMQFIFYIQSSYDHPHKKKRAYDLLQILFTEDRSFQLKNLIPYLFLYIELNQRSGELITHDWFQHLLKKLVNGNDPILFELINYYYFSMDKTLSFRHQFYQKYCDILSTVLNPAYVQKLAEFYEKLSDMNLEKNISYRNMAIVELRSILDKAFLDFYIKNYKKPIQQGKRIDIYFPVIPRAQSNSAEKGLEDYFSRKKSKGFKKHCPVFYDFLLKIQPLSNSQYTWLEDLYNLANRQKHEEDLELIPHIDGRLIDMNQFFPKVFDGLIYILLKMSNLDIADRALSQYKFAHFFLNHIALSLTTNNQQPISAETIQRKIANNVQQDEKNKHLSHSYQAQRSISSTPPLSSVSLFRVGFSLSNNPALTSNNKLQYPLPVKLGKESSIPVIFR